MGRNAIAELRQLPIGSIPGPNGEQRRTGIVRGNGGKEGSEHAGEGGAGADGCKLNAFAPPALVIEYIPSEPEPARFHVKPGADRPALAKCRTEAKAQAYVALRCS